MKNIARPVATGILAFLAFVVLAAIAGDPVDMRPDRIAEQRGVLGGVIGGGFVPPTRPGVTTVFTSTAKGLAPASGGGTDNFLRADGTWAAVDSPDPIIVTGIRFATVGRSSSMDPGISAGGTFDNLTIWKSTITVEPPGGGSTVTGILWDDDESDIALPFVFLFNAGAGNLTLTNEGGGSSASNRFALIGSASVVIPPRGGALLMKVNMPAPISDTRWVIVARNN